MKEDEEEEETDYETDKQIEASGLSNDLQPCLGDHGLRSFPKVTPNIILERLEKDYIYSYWKQKLVKIDYMMNVKYI